MIPQALPGLCYKTAWQTNTCTEAQLRVFHPSESWTKYLSRSRAAISWLCVRPSSRKSALLCSAGHGETLPLNRHFGSQCDDLATYGCFQLPWWVLEPHEGCIHHRFNLRSLWRAIGTQHYVATVIAGGCSKLGTRKRVPASLLSGEYKSLRGPSAFVVAFAMQFRKAALAPSCLCEHCDTQTTDYCEITYLEFLPTLVNP